MLAALAAGLEDGAVDIGSQAFADALDAADQLASARQQFHIPPTAEEAVFRPVGGSTIYLCGNSLTKAHAAVRARGAGQVVPLWRGGSLSHRTALGIRGGHSAGRVGAPGRRDALRGGGYELSDSEPAPADGALLPPDAYALQDLD